MTTVPMVKALFEQIATPSKLAALDRQGFQIFSGGSTRHGCNMDCLFWLLENGVPFIHVHLHEH